MPADEDDVLLRVAEVGHHLLGLGEDRVVAAARAPADLLVGHEVLAGQLDDGGVLRAERRLRSGSIRSWPLASVMPSPDAEEALGLVDDLGDPERLAADPVVADGVDRGNGPGSASASWPRLTSGISTRR